MRRALAANDVVMFAVGVWLASVVKESPTNLWAVFVLPFAFAVLAKLTGLYDNDVERIRHETIEELGRVFFCVIFVGLVGTVISPLVVNPGSRAFSVVIVTLLVLIGRATVRRIVVAATPPERCVLIGSDDDAIQLTRRFERADTYRAKIVDRVSITPGMLEDKRESREQLSALIGAHRAERVIVVPRAQSDLEAVRALTTAGVKVSILPTFLEVVGTSWVIDDLGGMNLLGVKRPALNRSSLVIKRTFDLALAIPGAILISPLMLAIALAIKLDSRGPAIFRQRRAGRRGEEFTMYKFRTMVVGAHDHRSLLKTLNEADSGLFKINDDPRVTRVGRILRKTSLDELPQVFNVILGSMSLVGPRPLIPEEDSGLSGWARFREKIPPGMTGPWQIGGSSKIPIDEMAGLDYLYATEWSLWLDIKILIRTAVFMLGRKGR